MRYRNQLTYSPLPRIKDLFTRNTSYLNADISNIWLKNNDLGFWLSRSSWSIYTIAKYRMQQIKKEVTNICMPDYFCNESLDLLRKLNVNIKFYKVDMSGNADLSSIESLFNGDHPDIILYVHYFGKCADSRILSNYAVKIGAWLIEDATHCLKPERDIGSYGDFVMYSPHKLVPIPNGALLIIRPDGPSKIFSNDSQISNYEIFYQSILTNFNRYDISEFIWLAKRLFQKLFFRINRKAEFGDVIGESSIRAMPQPKMSKLGMRLLVNLASSLGEDSVNRINKQEAWKASLIDAGILSHDNGLNNLPFTPYQARFSFENSKKAEYFFKLLTKYNISATTWPDLPPEVMKNPEKHKDAIKMRNIYLYFPLHSSIENKDISLSIERIDERRVNFV